jgi:hypothetical protein
MQQPFRSPSFPWHRQSHANIHKELLAHRLTRKDTEFVFGTEEIALQEKLKAAIVSLPAIPAIDYNSEQTIYLLVDTSYITIGYVLTQQMPGSDTKHYPSCFSSMLLNEREANYSQLKRKLYGLFRSLHTTRLYIIGVKKLVVEVNAKYIRGMLNNPNIQPNATINRWIASILLFDFKLVHVPSATHGPNGLSHQPAQPDHRQLRITPSPVTIHTDEGQSTSRLILPTPHYQLRPPHPSHAYRHCQHHTRFYTAHHYQPHRGTHSSRRSSKQSQPQTQPFCRSPLRHQPTDRHDRSRLQATNPLRSRLFPQR